MLHRMLRPQMLVWLLLAALCPGCRTGNATETGSVPMTPETVRPGAVRAAQDAGLLDGNMVGNPGFEYDWHNNNAEGHVLAFRADWSFHSGDLKPDYWQPAGNAQWVSGVAHTGTHSLLLKGGASVTRTFPMGVVPAKPGGGDSRWSGPPQGPMSYDKPATVGRAVRAAVWYRSTDLGNGNKLVLSVNSCGAAKSAEAVESPEGWGRLEAMLSREEVAAATKATPQAQSVTIQVVGAGQVWIDDVSFAEDLSEDPDLAVNGSFEELDNNGYPGGWSQPMKYKWRPPYYYKWTDWYHWFREIRGEIGACDMVVRSGRHSLRMPVLPGDEAMVEAPAVVLNQADRGIVEIGVYVLIDGVKWVDILAADENGNEVPTVAGYVGGWRAPQDSGQIFPSNAPHWTYVRKWFQGVQPLKSIRPRLCARGFNGDTRDDGGTRPQCTVSGIVWWDDLRVVERSATPEELKARGATFAPAAPKPDDVVIRSLHLGERLWGENVATVVLSNPSNQARTARLSLAVLPPDFEGELYSGPVTSAEAALEAGESKTVALPYTISKLEGEWDLQGRMRLDLTVDGRNRSTVLPYNTWPVVVDVDFSKHYATPNENPQTVALNLGVAQATLAATKTVVVEARRRRDDQVVQTVQMDPAAEIARTRATEWPANEFGVPGPVGYADKNNLIALKMDFGQLPVHLADRPVRDHYLAIRGLDAQGNELFADRSQSFGRVQPNTEVLPKIEKTEVREDGAVLINGEPVFLMGGNGYTTGHYGLSAEQNKSYGFNCIRWVEDPDGAAANWNVNMYSLETMIRGGLVSEESFKKLLADGKLDGTVTIAQYYESSSTHLEMEKEKEYARLCRVANRISNFGGGGAHNVYTVERMFGVYDSFGLELEPFGPPHGGYDLAAVLRKGGTAWFHLPQTYNTTPFEQFRVDQYEMIIQGGRGYSTIHGLGDPSLMRGINGEMRYLSPAIFSLNKGDPRTQATPDIHWMQRRVGNRTTVIATSVNPVEVGEWTWRTDNVHTGARAHTGVSGFKANQTPDGLRMHAYRQAKPILIEKGDRFVQYVWLDPDNPPTTVACGPNGDAKWDFNGLWGGPFDFGKWKREKVNWWAAGELLAGTWQIAWQDNQATWDWFAANVFTAQSFHKQGDLPQAGVWTRLELSADELGLVGKQIDGFTFIAKDGEAWWDHTALLRGGEEIVLCEDHVGFTPEEVEAVRFSVPWAADGTRVKVLFEERDLVVENGEFVDDFLAPDTYGAIGDGAVGDAEGWYAPGTRLYAQTLGHITPNAPNQVHIYEIEQ